jgi:hypothetical protein
MYAAELHFLLLKALCQTDDVSINLSSDPNSVSYSKHQLTSLFLCNAFLLSLYSTKDLSNTRFNGLPNGTHFAPIKASECIPAIESKIICHSIYSTIILLKNLT